MTIDILAERANADGWLVHRGRRLNLRFLLGVGEADYIVSIRDGRVESAAPRRLPTDTGVFSIRATDDVWADFWSAEPPRDRHDIFSMVAAGLATLDGELLPLMQNLQYFKDLLAAPRAAAVEA